MTGGTIRSRTTSGPCCARYLPAASAASSATGMTMSEAASHALETAEERTEDVFPEPRFNPRFAEPSRVDPSPSPAPSPSDPCPSCESILRTANVAAPVAAAAPAAFRAVFRCPPGYVGTHPAASHPCEGRIGPVSRVGWVSGVRWRYAAIALPGNSVAEVCAVSGISAGRIWGDELAGVRVPAEPPLQLRQADRETGRPALIRPAFDIHDRPPARLPAARDRPQDPHRRVKAPPLRT